MLLVHFHCQLHSQSEFSWSSVLVENYVQTKKGYQICLAFMIYTKVNHASILNAPCIFQYCSCFSSWLISIFQNISTHTQMQHKVRTNKHSSQFQFVSAEWAETIRFGEVTESNNPAKSFGPSFGFVQLFWSRFQTCSNVLVKISAKQG